MKPNLANKLWERFKDRACNGVTTTNCKSQHETSTYESVFKIYLEFADIKALNLYLVTAVEILRDAGGEILFLGFTPNDGELLEENNLHRILSIRYKHTKEQKEDK